MAEPITQPTTQPTSGPTRGQPRVSAVVLAYGQQPLLERTVDAVLASRGAAVDVVLVDNGGDPATVEAVVARPGVTLLSPSHNLGFAAGSDPAPTG